MSKFIFTPGQREEALSFIQQSCPDLYKYYDEALTGHEVDLIIDLYFKMKQCAFDLHPREFIVGVEYKDEKAVIAGTEAINIRMNNPRRSKQSPHDQFALTVMANLLNRLKE